MPLAYLSNTCNYIVRQGPDPGVGEIEENKLMEIMKDTGSCEWRNPIFKSEGSLTRLLPCCSGVAMPRPMHVR